MEYLAYPEIKFGHLVDVWPELKDVDPGIHEQMEIEAQYAGYLERQEADIRTLKKDENVRIPETLSYEGMPGLSNELRLKLSDVRPETIGQAGRIEGITPSALLLILSNIRRMKSTA